MSFVDRVTVGAPVPAFTVVPGQVTLRCVTAEEAQSALDYVKGLGYVPDYRNTHGPLLVTVECQVSRSGGDVVVTIAYFAETPVLAEAFRPHLGLVPV
jgi:hypothetical protein